MEACYDVSNSCFSDELKRRAVLNEAHEYGKKALELEPDNNEVLKWCAIITGSLAEMASTKERITLAYEFKNCLDKAATNNPDSTIFHMRGRFAYHIASLSWLERTAATVVFGAPPFATLNDALSDLLRAEEMSPGQIDNQLYIAKCYMDQDDEENARKYLTMVVESCPFDAADEAQQNEARMLLTKLTEDKATETDNEEPENDEKLKERESTASNGSDFDDDDPVVAI